LHYTTQGTGHVYNIIPQPLVRTEGPAPPIQPNSAQGLENPVGFCPQME